MFCSEILLGLELILWLWHSCFESELFSSSDGLWLNIITSHACFVCLAHYRVRRLSQRYIGMAGELSLDHARWYYDNGTSWFIFFSVLVTRGYMRFIWSLQPYHSVFLSSEGSSYLWYMRYWRIKSHDGIRRYPVNYTVSPDRNDELNRMRQSCCAGRRGPLFSDCTR